jgi:hypothetical protein
MEITFSWIINNGGGVNTQASYPWSGVRSTCRYSANNNGAVIKYTLQLFFSLCARRVRCAVCACACAVRGIPDILCVFPRRVGPIVVRRAAVRRVC